MKTIFFMIIFFVFFCREAKKEADIREEISQIEAEVQETSQEFEISDASPIEVKEKEEKDIVFKPPKWKQLGVPFPQEFVFKSITGFGKNAIFFVGAGAVVYKYNGAEFENLLTDPKIEMLNGIWGSSQLDLWAVGIKGAILHYSKKSWESGGGCKTDKDCPSFDPCLEGKCINGQCEYFPTMASGCCGSSPFSANFDDNTLNGFTVKDIYAQDESKGGIVWQVFSHIDPKSGKPRWTSPPNSLYFGITTKKCNFNPELTCPDFDNGKAVGSSATSPLIKIPKSEKVLLKFALFLDVEQGSYDSLIINVINGNEKITVWDKIKLQGPYGNEFHPIEADLSNFSGKEISIEIFFDSKDSILNNKEGIYIDDIKIETTCGFEKTKTDFPTLFDIHGTSENNIWAVGLNGTIIHYNGKNWKKISGGAPPLFKGICENNEGNILFVGNGGTVFISDGSSISKLTTPSSSNLNGCAGNIVVGINGTLLKLIDETFSIIPSPSQENLNDAFKTDDQTIWVVGNYGVVLKIVGNSIDVFYVGEGKNLFSIWGENNNDIVAVGEDGRIFNYKEGTWQSENSPTTKSLFDIWGIKNGSIYAVGEEGVIIKRGKNKIWQEIQSPVTKNLTGVYAFDENTVFAVGLLGTILFLNNGKFIEIPSPTKKDLFDIWGKGKDEIYAAGSGIILKWDGKEFKIFFEPLSTNLRGVFALNDTLAYATGDHATVLKYDGKMWSKVEVKPIKTEEGEEFPITQIIYKVFANSPEDVWAVGEKGLILKLKDSSFEFIPTENEKTLRSIFGIFKNQIWACGTEGVILFFDGKQWKKENSGTIATLYDLWAEKDSGAFVVGDRGVLLFREIK